MYYKILEKILINLHIYIVKPIIRVYKPICIFIIGEERWYEFSYKIGRILNDVLLKYIWIIKRSKKPICEILKKILSEYDWFNNNIIKF